MAQEKCYSYSAHDEACYIINPLWQQERDEGMKPAACVIAGTATVCHALLHCLPSLLHCTGRILRSGSAELRVSKKPFPTMTQRPQKTGSFLLLIHVCALSKFDVRNMEPPWRQY